jgi:hypothetical protein
VASFPALSPSTSSALRCLTFTELFTFSGGLVFLPDSDNGVPLESFSVVVFVAELLCPQRERPAVRGRGYTETTDRDTQHADGYRRRTPTEDFFDIHELHSPSRTKAPMAPSRADTNGQRPPRRLARGGQFEWL